jgi:DNA-binding MarR family transcriptional regulator
VIANKPDRLTGLTTYLLSQTAKVAKGDLDDRLADEGFRLRHMSVLAVLDEAPATQLDLSRRLMIDPSDVTATVDDLETNGLATRSMDAADRRRKIVTLTASGRKKLEWMQKVAQQLCDELLEPVPERRRAQLHQDLHRILLARDARETDHHQEER